MKSKLALISLLLGIFSFVHLFGIEKAVLAIIFGTWALKESSKTLKSEKIAWFGISLGLAYIVVILIMVIFYFPKLITFLEKIK